MKKLLLAMLMVCLLVAPAHAEELTDQPIEGEANQQEQEDCVTVGTLEELQLSIATANDGDCITVSQTIYVERDCDIGTTDKRITIIRKDGFLGNMVCVRNSNVHFINANFDGKNELANSAINCADSSVMIEKCNFSRNKQGALFISYNVDATILDCTFTENENTVIDSYSGFKMSDCLVNNNFATISCISISTINEHSTIVNCTFENNTISGEGGVFCIMGPSCVEIADSNFIGNLSENGRGAAIYNGGNTTINDCLFISNKSGVAGDDIYNWGDCAIAVNNTDQELTDLYNRYAFIYDGAYKDDGAKLSHDGFEDVISNDDIEENRFVDCEHSTRIDLPIALHSGGIHFEAHEKPMEQQPEGQPGDSEQPPKDTDKGDTPTDTTNPPQDNSSEDIPPLEDNNPNDPPQKPSEPPKDDNTNEGDTDYRPIYRPVRPIITVTETQPEQKPVVNPVPAQSPLVCNGVVIDTSRTIVLLGYGDDLAHEDDPLTRAQLATIIYRLLEDESIDKYSNAELAFTDVATDAWYAPYVRIIQAAGIVNGVGDGKYNPNGTVTWAQIVPILTRFVEQQNYTLRHIQYNGWAQEAIQTAVALGWIEDSVGFDPNAIITRGELVQLINFVLTMYK